jgi:hypothetical protein
VPSRASNSALSAGICGLNSALNPEAHSTRPLALCTRPSPRHPTPIWQDLTPRTPSRSCRRGSGKFPDAQKTASF